MGSNDKLAATFHPGANNHPSVIARNHLLDIASIWPELEARVARGGSGAGERVTGATKNAPIPIEASVVDVMAAVEAWVVFLVHVLTSETDFTVGSHATPALLRQVAQRVGHFTEHEDQLLAVAFEDDAKEHARKTLNAARPPLKRWIRLGVACLEHGTSDLGERIVCTGQYGTLLGDGPLGDMICEKDSMHRMTPLEWQRGQRRGAFDEEAMQELVRRVLRVGGAG